MEKFYNTLINIKSISRIKFHFRIVGFILFLSCTSLADAATYYISFDGSDNNSGTIEQPFRTIKYAVSKLEPGDILYIRGGDYREDFPNWDYGYIDGIKGTSSNPILISAYQKEKPIFSNLTVKNSEWLEFNGFQITGYQPLLDNWKDLPEIVIDDPSVGAIDPKENRNTRGLRVRKKYASYMKLKDNPDKSWKTGVTINNTHSCIFRNTEISKFRAGITITDGSSNNQIISNIIHHTINAIFTSGNSDLPSAENNIISNNHFYQNFFSAVRLRNNAKGNLVENNLSEFNGVQHMDTHSGGSNNIFRYNTLLYAGFYAETMRNPGPSGISIHSAGPGNVVDGNFIAFQIDVTGNDGGGIITDYTDHQTIIRNNILYRNMGHGFVSTHSGKNIVVHNVFAENGYNSSKHKFGIAMSKSEDVNHIIANNIFYKNKSGGMFFGGRLNQQKFIDYNLYFQPRSPIVVDNISDNSTHFYDLLSYQNATGFGKHSINKDPLFLDPGKGIFHLQIDSPARDAASPLHSAGTDKEGMARPSRYGPDIGAYEH